MNMVSWQITAPNAAATEALGQKLGGALKGGEVIELVSDVGGGKTTFVRGVARGIGSQDHVASPTFTISREYKGTKLTLHHYDFYRLHEPGEMVHELGEHISEPHGVTVVEWGASVQHVLPDERLVIHIKSISETERQFNFSAPSSLNYLIEAVQ